MVHWHVISEKGTSGERDDEPCLVKVLLCVANCGPSLKQKFHVGENKEGGEVSGAYRFAILAIYGMGAGISMSCFYVPGL